MRKSRFSEEQIICLAVIMAILFRCRRETLKTRRKGAEQALLIGC